MPKFRITDEVLVVGLRRGRVILDTLGYGANIALAIVLLGSGALKLGREDVQRLQLARPPRSWSSLHLDSPAPSAPVL